MVKIVGLETCCRQGHALTEPLINVHRRIEPELKTAAYLIAQGDMAIGRIWENALAVGQTKTADQVSNFRSDFALMELLTNVLKKIDGMRFLAICLIAKSN